jgi:hypothetical protein
MTLKELIKAKPEWGNLPMAVLADGQYHYINASGAVYDSVDHADKDENDKPRAVLVFSAN